MVLAEGDIGKVRVNGSLRQKDSGNQMQYMVQKQRKWMGKRNIELRSGDFKAGGERISFGLDSSRAETK